MARAQQSAYIKLNSKGRLFFWHTFHRNRPAQLFNDLFRDRKAQATSFFRASHITLIKTVKNMGKITLSNSDPVIRNTERKLPPISFQGDLYMIGLAMGHNILDKIIQNAPVGIGIQIHYTGSVRDINIIIYTFFFKTK